VPFVKQLSKFNQKLGKGEVKGKREWAIAGSMNNEKLTHIAPWRT